MDAESIDLVPVSEVTPYNSNFSIQPWESVTTPSLLCPHSPLKVAITDDGGVVGSELMGWLRQRGIAAELVHHVAAKFDGVVFLGPLRSYNTQESAFRVNREGLQIAKTLEARLAQPGGFFVAVSAAGGLFAQTPNFSSPWLYSGVPALLRNLGVASATKSLDLELGSMGKAGLVDIIGKELFEGGLASEVGITRDGTRYLRHWQSPEASVGVKLTAEDVVVLGYDHLNLAGDVARELASTGQGTVILLEPTAGTKRSAPTELLEALQATGIKAKYVSVDHEDLRYLARALDVVRGAYGRITGFVYASQRDYTGATTSVDSIDRWLQQKTMPLLNALRCLNLEQLNFVRIVSAGTVESVPSAMLEEILAQIEAKKNP